MSTFVRRLAIFNQTATTGCARIAVVLLAAMTFVILLQVFCRYILNAPLAWPEEASRYMMVWITFLVTPFAYRDNQFIRLETLFEKLSTSNAAMIKAKLLCLFFYKSCIVNF